MISRVLFLTGSLDFELGQLDRLTTLVLSGMGLQGGKAFLVPGVSIESNGDDH